MMAALTLKSVKMGIHLDEPEHEGWRVKKISMEWTINNHEIHTFGSGYRSLLALS